MVAADATSAASRAFTLLVAVCDKRSSDPGGRSAAELQPPRPCLCC